MDRFVRVRFCAALALVVTAFSLPALAQQLRTELALVDDSRALDVSDEMLVRFLITNDTDQPLYILSYQTPLDGFTRNLFLVERVGEPVRYKGVMVLREGPTAQDWVRMEPDESLATVFDLSAVYDVRRSGTYSVQFRGILTAIQTDNEKELPVISDDQLTRLSAGFELVMPTEPKSVESNTILLPVEGELDLSWVTDHEASGLNEAIVPLDVGCSNSQSSSLRSSQSSGRSMSSNVYSYYYSYGNNSHYRTWFGTYNSSRFSTVTSNFSRIRSAMGRNYDYRCGGSYCSGGVVAYVYPSIAYRVYICSLFWNYGSSNRAAIIVHESSHFNVAAGTNDYTYGYSNCQSLAARYPSYAIRNADNYRYAAQYGP